ncbi:MAG: hypothetical protein JSS99_08045 [Actinobacteria bacterium]|nr:hypothetical protein [Actinomycetota bacterium]
MVRRAIAFSVLLAALAPAGAAAAPRDDLALAQRLRPRLFFDSKERWRPLDVDRFLAEPGHQACPPAPAACVPLTSVAQLTPAVDHLDLRGDGPPDLPGPSAIYAHVVRRGGRIAIDYWWFLRYNAYSLDVHEGDWEGVTVIADRRGRHVLDVHFAAHADAWRYPARVPLVRGGRVAVFAARGDHASYPRPCLRRCRQTDGTLPEARFDGRLAWSGNTAAGCRDRCVRLLPAHDGAPSSWDAWPGRWGVTTAPAFAAPRSPAFQTRFRHPFAARPTARDFF